MPFADAMLKVVYPGTFDPFTRGHEDLVRRASTLFGHVVVAVAASESKGPFFPVGERVAMAREVLAPLPNVEVTSFSTLLMQFVKDQEARVILRGLRAVSDFEYEFQMALMNRHLNPRIETVFLMPREDYSYLSSRLVKEVFRLGGNIEGLVPPPVIARMAARLARPDGEGG